MVVCHYPDHFVSDMPPFLCLGQYGIGIKAILKEPDGIVMIYKHCCPGLLLRWPKGRSEVTNLHLACEFYWLMSGIDIEQPKAIKVHDFRGKRCIKRPYIPSISAFSGAEKPPGFLLR